MDSLEDALLFVADAYAAEAASAGGKSLARVATIVVKRGSFFGPLREGKTCSVRNYSRLMAYFADPANWPSGAIPQDTAALIERINISASATAEAA